MAKSWVVSVLMRRNYLPVVSSMQPKPIFFTKEQEERMASTHGSYRFKGGQDGKRSETH